MEWVLVWPKTGQKFEEIIFRMSRGRRRGRELAAPRLAQTNRLIERSSPTGTADRVSISTDACAAYNHVQFKHWRPELGYGTTVLRTY